ncbi:MAG: NUDIX domain-containing protein [Thermodesulfovibrionia bacterium]
MYRFEEGRLHVLLVHPGGPFWENKDMGAWSIPKGLIDGGEDELDAAKREFEEETGFKVSGRFIPLSPQRTRKGKIIKAWAVEGYIDASNIRSNTFQMEWPPHSGRMREFPEVDRAGWFDINEAKRRIIPSQLGFLEELERVILG